MKQISLLLCALCALGSAQNFSSFEKKLGDFSNRLFEINQVVDSLTRQFEVAAAGHNLPLLKSVLQQSTPIASSNITFLKYDLEAALDAIEGISSHVVAFRLAVQQDLLTVNAYSRQLRTVQLESLGLLNQITTPPKYVLSDRVTLAAQAVASRLLKVGSKLAEVDQIFEAIRVKHQGGPINWNQTAALEGATRVKVLRLLKEVPTEMAPLKAEFEGEFYGEVERLRLRGEELHLQPRFGLYELTIDMMNGVSELAIKYAHTIEEHDKF